MYDFEGARRVQTVFADLCGGNVLFFPQGIGSIGWSLECPTFSGNVIVREGTLIPVEVAPQCVYAMNASGLNVIETRQLASALERQPTDPAALIRRAVDEDLSMFIGGQNIYTNIPPLRHQWLTTAAVMMYPSWLIWDEMGTGKTKGIVDGLSQLYFSGSLSTVVVVCPNTAKWNWERETKKQNDLPFQVLDGSVRQMRNQIRPRAVFYSINYESARVRTQLLTELLGRGPSALVIDESHRCKNPKAKITKALQSVRPHANRCYLLSGSPRSTSVIDLYPQAWFLDFGKRLGGSISSYEAKFSAKGHPFAKDKNQSLLRASLADRVFVRKKRDLLDLPPKLYQRRDIILRGEQRRAYDELANEFRTWVMSVDEDEILVHAEHVWTVLMRLRQLASNPRLLGADCGDPAKFKELDDLLQETDSKVVVWTTFRGNVEELKVRYSHLHPALLYGKISGQDRFKEVDRFQNDPRCRLCLGIPQAGGESVNLTAASVVVYLDRDWNPISYWQSQDRTDRYGQTQKVTIVLFVGVHTVDERIDAVLSMRQEEARISVGGGARPKLSRDWLLSTLGG